MADYNSTNTGAVIDAAVDAVELAKAAAFTDATAGRLLKIRDFGLGDAIATAYPKSNIDDATCPTGFYRVTNTIPSAGTRPTGFSDFGYIQVYTYDGDDKMQVYTAINGISAFRVLSSGGNSAWKEYFHSGNSVNPLDFGIGVNDDIPQIGNFNTADFGGLFRTVGGEVGSPQTSSISTVLNMKNSDTQVSQLFVRGDSLSNDVNIYARGGNVLSQSFTDWVELYHSGNNGLITYGSNSNGSFTRFPDGTMICYHSLDSSAAGTVNWTFPSAFIASAIVTGNAATGGAASYSLTIAATSNSSVNFSVFNSANARIATGTRLTAIGRWK
jgi:hypothetical protein